jgi:hypothetical protein
MSPDLYMVFDVESIGLHGEGFAVGWVLVTAEGTEIACGREACEPSAAKGTDEDRAWIAANLPRIEPTRTMPAWVRRAFWLAWEAAKAKGAVLVADCAWPVEARFLAACVDDEPATRKWGGPYPLHDVATARLVAGLDPLAMTERLPSEEPKHCPLADARQSARLWLEAVARTKAALPPDPGGAMPEPDAGMRVTDETGEKWTVGRVLPPFGDEPPGDDNPWRVRPDDWATGVVGWHSDNFHEIRTPTGQVVWRAATVGEGVKA